MDDCCRRYRGSGSWRTAHPWADAHGYMLSPLSRLGFQQLASGWADLRRQIQKYGTVPWQKPAENP